MHFLKLKFFSSEAEKIYPNKDFCDKIIAFWIKIWYTVMKSIFNPVGKEVGGLKDITDDKNNKVKELDDFWDLSSLVHPKNTTAPSKNNIETVFFESEVPKGRTMENSDNSTVIKRYIDPLHYENKKIRRASYESEEIYYPENSLLHRVTLRKKKTEYNLYTEFIEDAKRYKETVANECEFVPYYSYVPQYNQLSDGQLSYYLWWRSCFNKRELIRTDYSYVLLYIFELINLADESNATEYQKILCDLWNSYHTEFHALAVKLAVWICDFSLLHKLPTSPNLSSNVIKYVPSLKEFFLNMPRGDFESCASSLIKYGTEYDYHTSKFAKGDNLNLFDKHIFGAVLTAVRFYSKDGSILSELASEDSKLIRNTFEGALCTSGQRYELEVKYCSFSRSNELRYLMADIVKYAENKIRTYIGVKSKLTVYSVSAELQRELDKYFESELFNTPKPSSKKEERHDYDLLYDLPKTKFSLARAKQIEKDSWRVTNDLISAFDEEIPVFKGENEAKAPVTFAYSEFPTPMTDVSAEPQISEADNEEVLPLRSKLGEYLALADAIKREDICACRIAAKTIGKMIDTAVDEINEIAVEEIGDVLIEELDGKFSIIECYKDMI